jgi:phenylalanyl-tRNA synthetase alpha chain
MQNNTITPARLSALLDIPDLTLHPGHAMEQVVQILCQALDGYPPLRRVQGAPIVSALHNYTLLGYPQDAIVRAGTYTQWVDGKQILRTQTTSLILQALIDLSKAPTACTLVAPGMVYRRDVRDRWHCGQPHQMDIWVLMPKHEQSPQSLEALVHRLTASAIPGVDLSIQQTSHPYTQQGIEISAKWQGQWLEIGEAGLIDPALLDRLGIDSQVWGGLAMGVGLDRLVMVHKNLPDIRLLRDPLPSIAKQMQSLAPWKPVSRQPVALREISIARLAGENEESLTEQVVEMLGGHASWLQSLEVAGRWSMDELIPAAVNRLGLGLNQENLLLRLTWQSESTSLERGKVNAIMKSLYQQLHQGSAWEYCP